MPLVPPETYVQVSKATGGVLQVKTENLATAALPQGFADRFGWPEMAQAVKAAYDTLTPEEQAKVCVIAKNYGEAGAVAFYGSSLGMNVPVISGHNSYYVWGPQGCTGEVMISLAYPVRDVANSFDSVDDAGSVSCQYCMPYENGIRVLILRGLKVPMQDAWPTTKMYN